MLTVDDQRLHRPRRTAAASVAAGLVAVLLLVAVVVTQRTPREGTAPRGPGSTYYVDCANGKDTNTGRSEAQAWHTLTQASKATLLPGDSLLIARGCVFTGQRLDAKWAGTAGDPILISAYGTGAAPVIRQSRTMAVRISGSYQIVEQLRAEGSALTFTPCGQPLGTIGGFTLTGTSRYNTVRSNQATGFAAGIRMARGSRYNTVQQNELFRNNMVDAFHADPSADLGAWGINVLGDDNDISYNLLYDNTAVCQNQGYKLASNSIEIFEAQRNRIHHNRAHGDRVFSELGSSATKKATGNVFAYNEAISDLPDARFIVTRGTKDGAYGPVRKTTVVQNSVYFTGPNSIGISCGLGCSTDILSLVNNVIWAESKVLYADGPFTERGNVYWEADGLPVFQAPTAIATTSVMADPAFVDPTLGDLRVTGSSPAIDAGQQLTSAVPPAIVRTDLAATNVPQGGVRDIGAWELVPTKR